MTKSQLVGNLNSYHLWLCHLWWIEIAFHDLWKIHNSCQSANCDFTTCGRNYTIPTPPTKGIVAIQHGNEYYLILGINILIWPSIKVIILYWKFKKKLVLHYNCWNYQSVATITEGSIIWEWLIFVFCKTFVSNSSFFWATFMLNLLPSFWDKVGSWS